MKLFIYNNIITTWWGGFCIHHSPTLKLLVPFLKGKVVVLGSTHRLHTQYVGAVKGLQPPINNPSCKSLIDLPNKRPSRWSFIG